MAYGLCFICTNRAHGFFESSKIQSTAGTLCELLQIKLRDSTFTFPPKLQQAPYCIQCVQKLKETHEKINNLRELEKQIEDVRKEVENKLKESCEKRRIVGDGDNSNDEDSNSEGEDPYHPFDQFREDVVEEVRPQFFSTINTAETKSCLKKMPTSTKEVVIELPPKPLKRKLREPNSRRSTMKMSLYRRSCLNKSSLEETLPENLNIGEQAVSSKKITLDSTDTKHDDPILKLEDDLSTAFISIMTDTDTEEGIHESQNSGSDVEDIDNLDDAEEIFVDATSDGRFQCPHAPVCKETFFPADKADFLNHVRIAHEGKIPKTTENLPVMETDKLFTCKFCEKVFTSTKLLKDHHIKHHEDEEWFPGHETTVKKKRIASNPSSDRSKMFTSFTVPTMKPKSSRSKERVHNCTYCDSSFTRSDHLISHLRTHTGDKPYKCEDCSEAFHVTKNLRAHLFKAHGKGDYFECNICKMQYAFQYRLTRHMKSHSTHTTTTTD